MYMSSSTYIIGLVIFIGFYFVGVVYLSKKRNLYLRIILPSIFACIALYNLIKPMIVYNPYPTMKEAIYMTFFGTLSILGFFILFIIKMLNILKYKE